MFVFIVLVGVVAVVALGVIEDRRRRLEPLRRQVWRIKGKTSLTVTPDDFTTLRKSHKLGIY
jgi:hypothetical protein